jgi:Xaa-Pro aminopeptidase
MIGLSSETILQKDLVLVLEPILRIPGIGGTKIENMVLVTADGAERFSALTLRPWREN